MCYQSVGKTYDLKNYKYCSRCHSYARKENSNHPKSVKNEIFLGVVIIFTPSFLAKSYVGRFLVKKYSFDRGEIKKIDFPVLINS